MRILIALCIFIASCSPTLEELDLMIIEEWRSGRTRTEQEETSREAHED